MIKKCFTYLTSSLGEKGACKPSLVMLTKLHALLTIELNFYKQEMLVNGTLRVKMTEIMPTKLWKMEFGLLLPMLKSLPRSPLMMILLDLLLRKKLLVMLTLPQLRKHST